ASPGDITPRRKPADFPPVSAHVNRKSTTQGGKRSTVGGPQWPCWCGLRLPSEQSQRGRVGGADAVTCRTGSLPKGRSACWLCLCTRGRFLPSAGGPGPAWCKQCVVRGLSRMTGNCHVRF